MNVNTAPTTFALSVSDMTVAEAESLLKAVVIALEDGTLTQEERQPVNELRLALVNILS